VLRGPRRANQYSGVGRARPLFKFRVIDELVRLTNDRRMQVSIYEAKTHLSRLIEAVENGEEVIVSRHNRPVVRLVPVAGKPRRRLGRLAGRPFRLGPGFDTPQGSERLADAFGVATK